MTDERKVNVEVELPERILEQLKSIAVDRGLSMTEALEQAISNESYLVSESKKGANILLEKKGNIRKVMI